METLYLNQTYTGGAFLTIILLEYLKILYFSCLFLIFIGSC